MTSSRKSGGRFRSPLTELESDVMEAVWSSAPCTVEAVHLVVSRKHKLKETSTRTLLRRLEKKGYLTHESDGRAYVYRPVEPARSLAARAVRQIVDRFCRGSVEELVSGMAEAKVFSEAEMEQLEKFVRERKAGSKPGSSQGR
jgi:BlaI family penicillinase repressor